MRLAKHQVPRKVKPQSLNFTSEDQPPGSVPTDSSAVVAASAFLRSPHGWPPRQVCHHPEVNSWSDDDCHPWIQFLKFFIFLLISFIFPCTLVFWVHLFLCGIFICLWYFDRQKGGEALLLFFGLVLVEFGFELWTLYFLRGSFFMISCFWLLVFFAGGAFYFCNH